MSTELGAALRSARIAKNLRVKDVAAHVGVTPSAISQWEAGTANPGLNKLTKACDLLGVNLSLVAQLRGGDVDWAAEFEKARLKRAPKEVAPAPEAPQFEDIVGLARDVPVFGNAVAGEDADFHLNGTETDRAIRPPGLANAKGIFALYVVNDSMYPAWREGALFYVNPNRTPAIGDDVVIEVEDGPQNEPKPAFLKRLKARRGPTIVVEQFNPPKEIEFSRHSVRIYRVVPWEEALGLS